MIDELDENKTKKTLFLAVCGNKDIITYSTVIYQW